MVRLHGTSFVGLEICNKNGFEAEEFCDEWYAFAISNLSEADPTLEGLEKFERKYHSSKGKNKVASTSNVEILAPSYKFNSYPF